MAAFILMVFIFACANRIRGMGRKEIGLTFGTNMEEVKINGNVIAAPVFAAYCAMVGLLSHPQWTGEGYELSLIIASLIAFVLGESMGWGKWVGIIKDGQPRPDTPTGRNNGVHFIANLLANETRHPRRYANIALALRGALWFGIALAPLYGFGIITGTAYLVASFGIGVGFPIAYNISITLADPDDCDLVTGWWEFGETMFGAWQGVGLLILTIAGRV